MSSAVLLSFVLLAPPARAVQPPAPDPSTPGPITFRTTATRLVIGRDGTVAADEQVEDGVAVLAGSLRIDGRVSGPVVVVGGNLDLGSTAQVEGDILVVGGSLERAAGARVQGRIDEVSLGTWLRRGRWFGGRADTGGDILRRWLLLALLAGRFSLLAVLALAVLVVFRARVARVGRAAAAEPLRAVVVGLIAEVVAGPVLLILSIALGLTVIGLPLVVLLVPAAVATLASALLLGYAAVACRIGEWIEDRLGWNPTGAWLTTSLGLLVLLLPTVTAGTAMVLWPPESWPARGLVAVALAAEFVAWTAGLGAVLLTRFGRSSPPPAPVAV